MFLFVNGYVYTMYVYVYIYICVYIYIYIYKYVCIYRVLAGLYRVMGDIRTSTWTPFGEGNAELNLRVLLQRVFARVSATLFGSCHCRFKRTKVGVTSGKILGTHRNGGGPDDT